MKKGLLLTLASAALLAPTSAFANGMATVKVAGNTTTNVDNIIEVNVKLTDIVDTLDGVVAFGGDLKYDKEYLEYVGSSKSEDTYEFLINEDILRIAGVDYTLENGIKDDTTVYTFKFKALKEGNTTVTFADPEVVDTDASEIESTVKPLNITINSKKETVKPVETKKVVKEAKPVEEVKTEVIEEKKEEKVETKEETGIINTITRVFKSIFKLFKNIKLK